MRLRLFKKKSRGQAAAESRIKMGVATNEANRWRNFLRKKTKKLSEQ